MSVLALLFLCPKKKKEKNKKTKQSSAFAALKARYRDIFDVNGKYFLIKMYAAEAFEHIQQVYSLTTLYLCLMPVEISLVVCAVLSIELAINIWATFHMESQEVRDRLLVLDIFTDLFCLAFPLCYTRFVLGGAHSDRKHVANCGVSNDFDTFQAIRRVGRLF